LCLGATEPGGKSEVCDVDLINPDGGRPLLRVEVLLVLRISTSSFGADTVDTDLSGVAFINRK